MENLIAGYFNGSTKARVTANPRLRLLVSWRARRVRRLRSGWVALLASATLGLGVPACWADSYTITVQPGYNLIANQLDNGDNTLNEILPSVPENTCLSKYTAGGWRTACFSEDNPGWIPNLTLNPGEGALLHIDSFAPAPLTFTGTPHVPVLPITLNLGLNLLSRQTNDIGTFENIVGFSPSACSTAAVYRFNPGPGRNPYNFAPPDYTVYTFPNGAWVPQPPTINVGEAVWIGTGPSTALHIASQPASAVVTECSNVAFTVVATGNNALRYQWLLNGQIIAHATNAMYEIAPVSQTNAGDYTVWISDECSPLISTPARLTVNPTVVITRQPATVILGACSDSNVTFAVVATGNSPLNYQWLFYGEPILGATGASYEVHHLDSSDVGAYAVRIHDSCSTVTSVLAFLTFGSIYGNNANGTPPQVGIWDRVTGALLRSYAVPNGRGIAVVGNIVYSTDGSNPKIQVTDASTGLQLGSIPTPATLGALAWDGSHLWGADYSARGSNKAYELDTAGNLLKTITLPLADGSSDGMEYFNGKLIVNRTDGGFGGPIIYDIYDLDGNVLTPAFITATNGTGIAYDGQNFFVSEIYNQKLNVFDGSTGAFVKSVPLTGGGSGAVFIEDLSVDYSTRPDTCASDITLCNDPGACGAVVSYLVPNLSGGCPDVTTACWPSSGSFFPVGTTTVNCTATNPAGVMVAQCSFHVTVKDCEPPIITCAGPAIMECSARTTTTNLVPGFNTIVNPYDNGAGNKISDLIPTAPEGTTVFSGALQSTFSADNPGWSDPNLALNQGEVVYVALSTGFTLTFTGSGATPTFPAPTVSDACDPSPTVTFGDVRMPGACPQAYSVTRTWTATDHCGNQASCSQTITVQDTLAPVLSCPVDVTVQRDADMPVPNPVAVSTTDCDPTPVVMHVSDVVSTTCPRTVLRTYKATDACGNVGMCTQVITVDTVIIISQPANATATECSNVTFMVMATGNGPLRYQWLFDGQPISGATDTSFEIVSVSATNAGAYTVRVSDACSAVVSTPTMLTVNPSVVITTQPASATVSACSNSNVTFAVMATGNGPLRYQWLFNGESIPGATNAAYEVLSVNLTNVGSYTVVIGDSCSTVTSALALLAANWVVNGSFEVTTPPMASNSFNNSLNPTTGVPGWTTDSGNLEVWCSPFGFPPSLGTNQLEINAQSVNQTVSQVVSNLDTNCLVTFCFDYAGRYGLIGGQYNNEFTVTLSGAYSLSVPLNPPCYTCGGWQHYCTNFVSVGPTLTISFTGMPHSPIDGGAHIDNVTLTQVCSDTTPPVIACPSDLVTNTESGQHFRVVTFSASASDNCDTNPVANCTPASGSMFPAGTNTVICTVTDAAGNTNRCTFTVTVNDAERPNITCPADLVVCADPGQASKSNVTYVVMATDNCPGVNVSCDPPSGSTFPLGATPVHCVATDAAGNSNNCSFTVAVNANTAVVALSNLTRCRGDTATYTAVTPGTAALSYRWTLDDSPIGSDSPLLVVATSGLTDGNHAVQMICTGACGAATNRATLTVQSCARGGPCSFTQGFYGNANGKFNGTRSITLISNLLATAPLVVGKTGVRSLTIPQSAVPLLQTRMPASGTPAALTNSGDQNLLTAVLPLYKGTKFASILLGQTITLSLNVRLDPALQLRSNFCTQGVTPGPDSSIGTADDVPLAGDVQTFTIPSSVMAALSDQTLGINDVTVRGLLELANRALAGLSTAGASLPDVNAAVDAINRGFDGCRVPVGCGTPVALAPNKRLGGELAAPKAMSKNISLTVQVFLTEGFNCDASKEPGEPDIAGNPGGKPVWWQWQATVSALVTIQTAGSSFDTLLGVFVGPTHSNVTLVASSDDTSRSLTAEVTFPATAGTNYLVVVDGFDGACGSVVLQIITGAPRLGPVNVLAEGEVTIGIEGELGRGYLIEASSDLTSWKPLAAVENSAGTLQFGDPAVPNSKQRFYRVVIEP